MAMSKVSDEVSTTSRAAFELDHFELGSGYCEVQGRWFGVRGRRFMRPALMVTLQGQPTRLLADLAHKPWSAEDGESWKAAFPCTPEAGELLDAELTVAPDITISLPAPKRRSASSRRKREPTSAASASEPADGRPPRESRTSRGESRERIGSDASQLVALRYELARAQDQARRLKERLARSEAEREAAAADAGELTDKLARITGERDDASRARDRIAAALDALQRDHAELAAERDAARREREQARHERDQAQRRSQMAVEAQDQALAERGAAIAAQEAARSERDAAVMARNQAAAECAAALAVRDHALAERDAAVAKQESAVAERDALARGNERLQSELSDLHSSRGAALVMRRAAREGPATHTGAALIRGAIALLLVAAVAVVLLIVLRAV
jgi:hypothetical protein